jgi:hypothetical protein
LKHLQIYRKWFLGSPQGPANFSDWFDWYSINSRLARAAASNEVFSLAFALCRDMINKKDLIIHHAQQNTSTMTSGEVPVNGPPHFFCFRQADLVFIRKEQQ